ncbi:hypothetical protein [Photobacterium sp.]|uniref:hypothetical protein n=1 Tax=Photobacterium sp. TaxID=660 RepID=UPI00299D4FBE|nr:hypothetical protein [Photobacterium sp.]MDX1303031.1 hypothetical protein [Photobacterium sp.]
MKKYISIVLLITSAFATASTPSGVREIETIGCHKVDNTCYVTIKGPAVGPVECQNNSVRFNDANDANGKASLSLITAAYFAGKKVSLAISDKCYLHQNIYPTFDYFSVLN